MINTKAVIVSGAAAAVAFMLLSKGAAGGDGGEKTPQERIIEVLRGQPAPSDAPGSTYNIPAQQAVVFPEQQDYSDLLYNFFNPDIPTEKQIPDVNKERAAIQAAHKKVVSSGFDISTTFTGTSTTPAFVQKGIYHKAMLTELGLSTKKGAALPAGAESVVSSLQSGFISRATGGAAAPSPKKSDYIPSQWRTREGKKITRSTGAGSGGSGSSNAAKKAISHAKRLRAGRGD